MLGEHHLFTKRCEIWFSGRASDSGDQFCPKVFLY
jgi:hypothetical protein